MYILTQDTEIKFKKKKKRKLNLAMKEETGRNFDFI